MKNVVTVVIGLIGAVGVIAGISYVEKRPDPVIAEAVEIVQDTRWNPADNMTIQDHLNQITGVDGEIAWDAFQTPDRPSDSVWVVEAVITKPETYAATEGVFQFTVNVASEIVEHGYIGIDGEPTRLLDMPGIFPLTLSKEEFEEYFSDYE